MQKITVEPCWYCLSYRTLNKAYTDEMEAMFEEHLRFEHGMVK